MNKRTAIVTGAGKRVGWHIAASLIDDGWSVLAHVRDGSDPVPDGAHKVVADLALQDCADRIFAAAEDLPPVALLINNAARFAWDDAIDFSSAEFDAHMAVNVRAPALLTSRFARTRRESDDSLIVNILDAKLAAPNPDYLSYTLSKHTLAAFTGLSARALAGQGTRVNGIAPALMLRSQGQSQENYEKMHDQNPLRRGVEPDDVVEALRYLVGARCVTGHVIVIDGGQRFLNLGRDVQFLEA